MEGEPVSEQFRAWDGTDLRTGIETMIEKHT